MYTCMIVCERSCVCSIVKKLHQLRCIMVTWLHGGIADGAGIPGRGSPSPLKEAIHAAILAAGANEPCGPLKEAIRAAAVQEGLGKDPLREASSSSRAPAADGRRRISLKKELRSSPPPPSQKPRRSVGLANAAVLAAAVKKEPGSSSSRVIGHFRPGPVSLARPRPCRGRGRRVCRVRACRRG